MPETNPQSSPRTAFVSPPRIAGAAQTATAPWFALTVHPKHELLAERSLRNQGFHAYLPVHRVRRRWSDRVKHLETALFPGYLFCRFERHHKLQVLQSPGVRSVVANGRDPIPVDDTEIRSVQALIDFGKPIDIYPYIRIGQKVQISGGPFASQRGMIVRANDTWRVVVSVEALGCSVSVEIDADQIAPV